MRDAPEPEPGNQYAVRAAAREAARGTLLPPDAERLNRQAAETSMLAGVEPTPEAAAMENRWCAALR